MPPAGLIDFHQITGGLGGSVTTGAAEVDRGSEDPKGGGAEKFELTPPEVWFQLKRVSSTNWLKRPPRFVWTNVHKFFGRLFTCALILVMFSSVDFQITETKSMFDF